MGVNIAELNQAQTGFLKSIFESFQPATGNQHVRFVQVGAHVSKQEGDPIYHYISAGLWKGLMIEPLPHIFEKLTENLKEIDGLTFKNCAVNDAGGNLVLNYPSDRTELASANRETVLSHFADQSVPLETVSVPCQPLCDLMAESDLKNIDILIVDTEGLDARIIQSLDFTRVSVSHILFENKHLTDDNRQAANKFLEENNYIVIEMGADTFASKAGTEMQSFFLMMQRIFAEFRAMERRFMNFINNLNQFTQAIIQNTPRS